MARHSALPNSRIMVVEDDESIGMYLCAMLEKDACIVNYCSSAESAIEQLPGFLPDLVLMDIMMDGMDGFEATRRMLELSDHGLPIVLITNHNDTQSIEEGFEAGACDYITKPLHWPLLKNRIDAILQRKLSEEQNAKLNARFRSVFDNSPMGIILLDLQGNIIEANRAASDICQIPTNHLYQLKCEDLMHDVSKQAFLNSVNRLETNQEIKIADEVIMNIGNGGEFCASIFLSVIRDDEHQPKYVVLMFDDITQRKRDESRLRLAARVFENASDGIMVTDAKGLIVDVNESFTEVTGYQRADVLGQNPSMLHSGRQSREFYQKMWQQLTLDGHWVGEIWNRRKTGEVYPERLSINAVTDEKGETLNYVGVFSDISGLKETEQRLKFLAYHDPLTRLANRLLFHDRVSHAIENAHRLDKILALIYVDLDHFKTINDTMGHDVGDSILEQVGERLSSCVRESDTVARLGGDEFAILMEQLNENDNVRRVTECILDKMTETFIVHERSMKIGASIGVSCYPSDAGDTKDLIRLADAAMYHAKSKGKNQIVFFQDEDSLEHLRSSVK